MARLVTAGAETRHASTEGGYVPQGTAPVMGTTHVRSGSRSFECLSGHLAFTPGTSLGVTYYARAAFYVEALPNGIWHILEFRSSGGTVLCTVELQGNGVIAEFHVVAGGVSLGNVTGIAASTWYVAELAFRVETGSTDYVEGRLDGVSVAASSAQALTDTGTGMDVRVGDSTGSLYIDDIAINDSNGANQNSWPGVGKVVLLLPTADSARGTGWVGGGGGTTNLFAAVDNTPPVGVADTGTDTSQIRNATSAANSNMDMTMTTYSAAGITAADTVNVVDPIVATAAPVTTGAKQGTVGVASNPTIANIALAAGGTAGAFWSGTAGGTYPTGWKISHGTVTYAPSVTVGTAPVMRITQVTSSTRIAMVCFMGMYVDYTPAAAAVQVPYRNPMPPLIAQ